MKTALERAAERVRQLGARRPYAVQLARYASVAMRVEPHLLRRLRVQLVRSADASAEADLWFSSLVESRDSTGFVLDAHVADVLREDLAKEPAELRSALAIIQHEHRRAPHTVQLEERLNGLSLLHGADATVHVDEALRPALRSVRAGGAPAREIAFWALRAMPRLHPRARSAENALALLLAAAALLGQRRLIKTLPDSKASIDAVAWALPPQTLATQVVVGVQLTERGLHFVAPEQTEQQIALPSTSPLLVELQWEDGSRQQRLVEVVLGREVELAALLESVTLRTLAGDEYELTLGRQPAARPESRMNPQANPDSGAVPEWLRPACVEIHALGENAQPCLGVVVADRLVLSVGRSFDRIPVVHLRWGSQSVQAQALDLADGTRFFVPLDGFRFEQVASLVSPSTRVTGRTLPEQGQLLVVTERGPRTLVVTGKLVMARDPDAVTFEVELTDAPFTPELVGALLLVGEEVGGIVQGELSRSTARTKLLVRTPEAIRESVRTARARLKRDEAPQPNASEPAPRVPDVSSLGWLRHAPPPRPRPANIKWDVFVAYRSPDRRRATTLYDLLRQCGYAVFFDQVELVAGVDLGRQLTKNLEESGSAVLLWSQRTRDSEWAHREFTALMAKVEARRQTSFPFFAVIAKLDDSPLPPFASSQLYVEWGAEGPAGPEILRLLSGLQGKPLGLDAAQQIAQADEALKAEASSLRALERMRELEEIRDRALRDSALYTEWPALSVQAIEALIRGKRYDDAFVVLDRAQQHFPRSLRLRQLRGQALRKAGRTREALRKLLELYEEGERDLETLSLLAATWAARYRETGEPEDLEQSRQLYVQSFELDPSDIYLGINAATKSALLSHTDAARKLAAQVLDAAARSGQSDDYWHLATVSEAKLLVGDFDGAIRDFREARTRHRSETASLAATVAELKQLLALPIFPPDVRQRFEQEFPESEAR